MSAINSSGGGGFSTGTAPDGSTIIVPSDAVADAFGRLRTSTPTSVFDNKQIFAKDALFYDEALVSGATSVHIANNASVRLTASTTIGSKATRQTRQHFPYHPGQSQLVLMTGVLGELKPGVRQRIGLFDDDNGLFFEQDGTELRVVRRTNVTGTPVDNVVSQANWNSDKFDGTGDSGTVFDPTKANIFVIDFAWLGVGAVRFGFQVAGRTFVCHEFKNENALTEVYISTPILPLRYEIETTGAVGSSTFMDHICTAVFSEGVEDPLGLVLSDHLGVTPRTLTAGTALPLIAIRAKSARKRISVIPVDFNVMSINKVDYLVEVYIGGSLNGVWASSSDNVEVNKTATTLTGGTRIIATYGSSTNQSAPSAFANIPSALTAAAGITGDADPISIVATQVANPDSDYLASITWKELF